MTAIEWTDATWNPTTGCSKVSPGCDHCYAETLSLRFGWSKLPWTPENAEANLVLHPERLSKPLSWRTPRRVFVNSMSDLFHERVPDDYIADVFRVMADAERHTFQVLTKRPERMAEWTHAYQRDPLPNVWLGTSIESAQYAYRANHVRNARAAVRFISAEPLLGSLYDGHRRSHWDLGGFGEIANALQKGIFGVLAFTQGCSSLAPWEKPWIHRLNRRSSFMGAASRTMGKRS